MFTKKLSVLVVALFVAITSVILSGVSAQEEIFFPAVDLTNPAAPFIFTYDYAVAQGATAEWRKQEGVVIDEANKKLYMAVTRTRNGMSDTEGDIQLAENRCGMVMVGTLDDNWGLSELTPLIIGGPYDEATELCDANNMSEPDNVFTDANGDLWIYEDTDLHVANMVWKYVVSTGELLRFANLPVGSEATGLRIAGNSLFLNIQHPDSTNPEPFNHGTVGVVVGYNPTDSFEPVAAPEAAPLALEIAAGEYQILARGGDTYANSDAVVGAPVALTTGKVIADLEVCENPDGNMFLPSNDEATAGILYTNWECVPGGVSRIDIAQGADGKWTVSGGSSVDVTAGAGALGNCNASVTPWNTGLTSEEEAPLNAEDWAEYIPYLTAYVGGVPNPYRFGYNTELTPNEDGTTTVVKHYAMGRRENEQAWVAPDSRTVYFGDDGTDKIFYRFVATTAGDLSAGTLYAAHLTQTGTDGVSDFGFTIDWIELGTSNNADIEAALQALEAGM